MKETSHRLKSNSFGILRSFPIGILLFQRQKQKNERANTYQTPLPPVTTVGTFSADSVVRCIFSNMPNIYYVMLF